MRLRMWMYDLAREQGPSLDNLRTLCQLSLESGFNAIGLYLEHRFAYPSAPWAHGLRAVTPEMVRTLQTEFPQLQIIPFLNLLGHCEGMIYTEEGHSFAEERFRGMQACPSNPDFVALCHRLLDDVLAAFDSEIIHIGADETWQLGACPKCRDRVQSAKDKGDDGKAVIYGEHFAGLARKVSESGRRPAIWGDMFADHPHALDIVPKNTLIFDWQYFGSPEPTGRVFVEAGFDVVYSPAIHTYNSVWAHLPQSEENIKQHAVASERLGGYGVCVTTWELGLFGNYETMLPAIQASGRILGDAETLSSERPPVPAAKDHQADLTAYQDLRDAPYFLKSYLQEGEHAEEWARLMGTELQNAGGLFRFGGIRSSIKSRLLLYSNPFLLWLRNREDLLGEPGDQALEILNRAISMAPNSAYRGVSEFVKGAIEFVRFVERAHLAYALRKPGEAITALTPCRQTFENLAKIAKANHLRFGGSAADVERCRAGIEHIERVIRRIKEFGDGSLGYLPSFEMITHPKFMPHDQGAWWLINSWANE